MPNVSDFYLDHTTGRAYFEMDDGSNSVKDLSLLPDGRVTETILPGTINGLNTRQRIQAANDKLRNCWYCSYNC